MFYSFNRFAAALLCSTALVAPAWGQSQVPDLTDAGAISGTDRFPVYQGSPPLKDAPVSALVTYLNANLSLGVARINDLGTGVGTFLGSPVGNIVSTWLASGAAVDSLGFTPPPNTRTVTGTGMLAGGGDLSANRTITLGSVAANSVLINATAGSAVPTAVEVPDCDAASEALQYTGASGFGCGTIATGGSISATDGTTTVNPATTLSFDPASFDVVDGGSGTAQIKLTSIQNDQSGGNYTVLTGDSGKTVLVGAFTYTLPQAGTTGFAAGWGGCFLNVGAGNAAINTTTSLFKGASGTTALTIRPGDWSCPASDGTNYNTVVAKNNYGRTANLPMIGGGAGVELTQGTRSGNTTAYVTTTGTQTSGRCVEIDADGNHIAASAACGSGSGSSTGLISFSTGAGNYSTAATYIGPVSTGSSAGAAVPYIVPAAMTVSGLACNANVAAGGAVTHTYTLNVNTSDNTNQQVSNTGASQTKAVGGNGGDADVGVLLARGDLLVIHVTISSGSPSTKLQCTIKATFS